MSIISALDQIVTDQLKKQKLRRDSIKFKQAEINKYNNFIKKEQERIEEIEKEIKETSLQMVKLVEIKKQLKETSCTNV